ncbi:MAG: insulinase family protein [Gammaproteobacteria bacterium]|nr:insulinase family protein [Gammaproteobacteria bacterium]
MNSCHPSFRFIRHHRIEALQVEFQEYAHRATGARHLHLASDDDNNVFTIAFPTIPRDSTGVAHILEHTTLCGSRNFPVRDPFFLMLRRSLNTFMNAFTGSDTTAYPFATRNRKDFDNLLRVYLDAVFFPILSAYDFAQEGHRLEFEAQDGGAERLVQKGVVYNEMKGAMSAPVTQLWHHLQAQLFPTTPYRHNSGGDPVAIPKLTHATLQRFHARHYHPSNAVIMTYGNFPAAEHQQRLDELALGQFQRRRRIAALADEQRFTAPREIATRYAAEDTGTDDRTHLSWGWLLGHTGAIDDFLDGHYLSGVLLDNSASPLRQLLETTPLAQAPSELCGLDDSAREFAFYCGVEGTSARHAVALEGELFGLFSRLARDGVPEDIGTAVIDAMEMAQRDIGGDGWPYGLKLMNRVLGPVLHGGDPIAFLDLDPALAALRQRAAEPAFIGNLIRRHLLDNPHRVRVLMEPDAKANKRRESAERRRLAARQRRLDEAQATAIRAQSAELRRRQETPPREDLLPKLTLADVPRTIDTVNGSDGMLGALPRRHYVRGTNGILLHHLVVPLPRLDTASLPWLPYVAEYLTDLGYGSVDYLQAERTRAAIGSFESSLTVRAGTTDASRVGGYLVFAGKALARKREGLFEHLAALYHGPRFDELPRLQELVAQARAEIEATLTERGHVLAMHAASAALSPYAWLDDQWHGPSGIRQLKALAMATRDEAGCAEFAARLAKLVARLQLVTPRLLVIGEEAECRQAETLLDPLWRDAVPGPERPAPLPAAAAAAPSRHLAWTTSTLVNFCARAYPAVAEGHPDAPVLMVLGRYLHNGYLHGAIRERGGAYGAGAGYAADAAVFRFYSYRDPRLDETLTDFDAALRWFHGHRNDEHLEQAILGVIGQIDHPSSPAGAAVRAFYNELHGRNDTFRLELRNRVLAVTYDDLARVVTTYLAPERSVTAVVTSAERAARLDSAFAVAAL